MTFAAPVDLSSLRVQDWLADRARALRRGVKPHAALHGVAVATCATALAQSALLGNTLWLGTAAVAATTLLLGLAIVIGAWLMADLAGLWRRGSSESPTLRLGRTLFADILTPGRVANGGHVFIATSIFAVGFASIKSNIPLVNPFGWDGALMRLDRAIHFGMLPQDILRPLLASPPVILGLNLIYNAWSLMMLGFVLWQGFREQDTTLRQRFLLAYLLTWVLGTCLIGTLLSSAGPCFYGRVVTGPDPYREVMSRLREINDYFPLWALSTQDMLWRNYVESRGTISGISAMPSMHVGTSVIFFLCAAASRLRWLTWATGFFVVAVLIGAIVLGWHYSVDCYAGALVALACWWLAGRWVARQDAVSSRPS